MDVALITDENMAVMGLTENVRRQDLSPMEALRAYRKAIDETELTARVLADQLGIAESTLSNNLRVLDLPHFILEHVETGALGITVAREFLVLQNAHHAHHEDMRAIVTSIVPTRTPTAVEPSQLAQEERAQTDLRAGVLPGKQGGFRPIGPKYRSRSGRREPGAHLRHRRLLLRVSRSFAHHTGR